MSRLLGREGERASKEPAVYGKLRLLNWKPGGWDWGLASLGSAVSFLPPAVMS